MVKHRIDVYLSTQSLMYVDKLKQEWKRENYSQTMDHMVKSYINLLEKSTHMKVKEANKEKKQVEALTDFEKKWGVINGDDWK